MIVQLHRLIDLRHYLEGFVEVEAEVGEHDPELLPAVAVLELAQQVTRQLVLQSALQTEKSL